MADSPLPSPQTSHGFPAIRGESPDKLSPVVPQRRSESPLKQAQAIPSNSDAANASAYPNADRRAINPMDNTEFLDLDADDTDTSPYDSVDDSGRASAVDSIDRPDDINGHTGSAEGLNGSRKDKKRAAVEDFPLPPNTPPVVHPGNEGVFATYQSSMPSNYAASQSHPQYPAREYTPPSDAVAGQVHEPRSEGSGHHDSSDVRTLASVSQTSLPPPYKPSQDDLATATIPPTFRSLPLLPNDLPHTTIQVTHSFIRPNDRGKDVLSFIITVNPGHGKETWNVEKLYSDVLTLDARVRANIGKSLGKKLVTLPEGRLWRDHAPAKVDQRKVSLLLPCAFCVWRFPGGSWCHVTAIRSTECTASGCAQATD